MPVPAGPIPKVTVHSRIASTYRFWPIVFGAIFLPRWRQTTSSKTSRMSSVWSSARDDCVDGGRPDLVPALDELDELVDDSTRGGDPVVRALDRQLVAAQADRAVQPVAQRVEHAVADSSRARRRLRSGLESTSCTRFSVGRASAVSCFRVAVSRQESAGLAIPEEATYGASMPEPAVQRPRFSSRSRPR